MGFFDDVTLPDNQTSTPKLISGRKGGFFDSITKVADPARFQREQQLRKKLATPPSATTSRVTQVATTRFPGTLEQLKKLQQDPLGLEKKDTPGGLFKKVTSKFFGGIKDAGQNVFDRFIEYDKAINPQEYGIKRDVAASEKVAAGLGVVSIPELVLSPISSFFQAGEELPVVGSVFEAIGVPFALVGEASKAAAEEAVDKLPISDKWKEDIKPGIGEIAELAGQIALGKGAEVGVKNRGRLTKKFGPKEAETIITQSKKLAAEQKTKGKRFVPEEVPTKRLGEVTEQIPPELQDLAIEARKLTFEQFKEKHGFLFEGNTSKNFFKGTAKEFFNQSKVSIPKTEVPAPKLTSKVAQSIEIKAIEAKLTEGFRDLAGFDPTTIKEQARLISDLVKRDLERAKRIALGEEAFPNELRVGPLFKVLEDIAVQSGDGAFLKKLAESPVTAETSRFASELSLLRERSPDSPVKRIQEVAEARGSAIGDVRKQAAAQAKTKTDIKKEITKAASKRPTWEEFIADLKC